MKKLLSLSIFIEERDVTDNDLLSVWIGYRDLQMITSQWIWFKEEIFNKFDDSFTNKQLSISKHARKYRKYLYK